VRRLDAPLVSHGSANTVDLYLALRGALTLVRLGVGPLWIEPGDLCLVRSGSCAVTAGSHTGAPLVLTASFSVGRSLGGSVLHLRARRNLSLQSLRRLALQLNGTNALDLLAELAVEYALSDYVGADVQLENPPSASPASMLRRAIAAMEAHPERHWTVEALARTALMGRSTFARHFAAEFRCSPGAYLLRVRMQRAKELLLRPDALLATVAGDVGYANQFAFAAAFKRHVGVSPGRWACRTSVRPTAPPPLAVAGPRRAAAGPRCVTGVSA
jgi:AraC-like DNA-binding protein